jgi:hypothetical protein
MKTILFLSYRPLYLLLIATIIATFLFTNCKKDKGIDKTPPTIDISFADAFPKNCDTLYLNETFVFKLYFSDNKELGSYNIHIHHNFDHHTHSTEITQCVLYPIKTPVNPFVFIQNYSIPENSKSYTATNEISIPSNIDTGDYHFMIRVTDKEGWQTMKGLSVKIIDRK